MANGDRVYDLLIIGGGINGVGIARDAAGRGLSVLLVEKDDLASHTSRWSSKLIHGGLRYLEQYEFRLVREALIEREVLLRAAPHIIWSLTFVLPHSPEQRPAWLVRMGLFLYDNLGGRKLLPGSNAVDLARPGPYGDPLQDWVKRGFTYSDAWVDDARLVVLNAMDAVERGAELLTHTTCASAARNGDHWDVELVARKGTPFQRVKTRCLINAAGPWVSDVLQNVVRTNAAKQVRLVKGSHLIVPRLHPGNHPYILQNDDKRIVFVIPYEQEYSLIGTTDLPYEGDPGKVAIADEETNYLLRVVNRYFKKQLSKSDIVSTYAGVRPLFDDTSANVSTVTRDYVFDLEHGPEKPPLLSIFGGKITTYRKLAEHALARLQPVMGFPQKGWTADSHLPGGDIPHADFETYFRSQTKRYPWMPEDLLRRWARAYGTRLERVIGNAQDVNDLGEEIGSMAEAELIYLRDHEWAVSADDVLWRRSKLGLHVPQESAAEIDAWFQRQNSAPIAESAVA
ncbi:MAG: glycerol-3-phosphate dehydrogenase [Pseudomonadota bacterium]